MAGHPAVDSRRIPPLAQAGMPYCHGDNVSFVFFLHRPYRSPYPHFETYGKPDVAAKHSGLGISLSFLCLIILGFMPVLSNSRPAGSDALTFAFLVSLWQLVCSLPLAIYEYRTQNKGPFAVQLEGGGKKRTLAIVLFTGMIFGLTTFMYVLAAQKAGAVSAAIALQAYPLFAILWESLFLRRRKTATELAFTLTMLAALYFLATNGTWRIAGLSMWFLFAMGIPFLWSVAHVMLKQVLDTSPVTPSQITFSRLVVSTLFLFAVLMLSGDPRVLVQAAANFEFQTMAVLMGLVYYLELITWFYAVRQIDVSLASSITVPAPAITMVLAVLFMHEEIAAYQMTAMAVVTASMYGLLFANGRKRTVAAGG